MLRFTIKSQLHSYLLNVSTTSISNAGRLHPERDINMIFITFEHLSLKMKTTLSLLQNKITLCPGFLCEI